MRIHAFTDDDVLGNRDAVSIAEAIQNKDISIREVVEATINRIEKVNPVLNGMVIKTYDEALHTKGANPNGFFYGVPTLIKDNCNLKGYPTQHGTGVFKAKIAKKNSGFVDQMLSTGLNYIGKSTMPELGLICSTENPKWGITRNPWNTDYTPAGSSSGSAALVASGALAIAQANDGAGSTRIPANCCGLVGLKPTRNRLVNHDGAQFLPINMVYEGVLTRSVRDTAAFYAEAEKFYKNPKFPAVGHVKDPIKRRLKIACFENPPVGETGHMDSEISRVQQETIQLLESLGHQVEALPMPYNVEKMKRYYLHYYGFLAFTMIRFSPLMFGQKIDIKDVEPFSYGLMKGFENHILKFPETLMVLKTKIKQKENELMSKYDVLMLPVTTIPTPKIGYFSPDISPRVIVEKAANYAPYPGMQNISGAPSISLPMGIDKNDMPVGVQFAAADGQEALLLELALELERVQPWRQLYNV